MTILIRHKSFADKNKYGLLHLKSSHHKWHSGRVALISLVPTTKENKIKNSKAPKSSHIDYEGAFANDYLLASLHHSLNNNIKKKQ